MRLFVPLAVAGALPGVAPAGAERREAGPPRGRRAAAPSLNVHVKADAALARVAIELNSKLTELCPTNGITFGPGGCCDPHNTLYMTAYEQGAQAHNYSSVGESLQNVARLFVAPCSTTLRPPYVSGTYVLWDLDYAHCLDSLAGATVSELRGLALKSQRVPGWVMDLPEPARTQKATCVSLYGSPNVFFQYEPHISIGYVDNDCKGYEGGLAAAVQAAYAAVPAAKTAVAIMEEIGYAVSGPYGTVPQGGELGSVKLLGTESAAWQAGEGSTRLLREYLL